MKKGKKANSGSIWSICRIGEIIKRKEWENIPNSRHIISTGGILSFSGFYQALLTLREDHIVPDVVITSRKIWGDMEKWGYGDCEMRTGDGKDGKDVKIEKVEGLRKSRGIGSSIWGADIYIDDSMPDDIIIIGSLGRNQFARVSVSG